MSPVLTNAGLFLFLWVFLDSPSMVNIFDILTAMEIVLIVAIAVLFFLIAISVIALVVIINGFIDHIRFGVQFAKTPSWILNWLSHNLTLSDGAQFIDLGCGDGRVLLFLKRAHPHVCMTGIEGAFMPFLKAKWKTRSADITIRYQNFYSVDLKNADVVFCFLTQHLMPELEQHLKKTLKKDATVYSYAFTFPTWKPTREVPHPRDPNGSGLYVYTL